MTKTEAQKIARHLYGQVHVVAASPSSGQTWGYSYACGDRKYTTASCGTYRQAVKQRSANMAEMVESLMEGTAPDYATMAFKW